MVALWLLTTWSARTKKIKDGVGADSDISKALVTGDLPDPKKEKHSRLEQRGTNADGEDLCHLLNRLRTGEEVYCTAGDSTGILIYAINSSDGALSSLGGPFLPVKGQPTSASPSTADTPM